MERCNWPGNNALMIEYHDKEWGVPLHDDQKLFEFLVLDAFQAGLSWQTIINKRENFRIAFDNFDAQKIALYDAAKIDALLNDAGIIRNRLKIYATISNAKAFLKIQQRDGSFNAFIWQFTKGKTIINHPSSLKDIPVRTEESDTMSKALIKEGFKFVGSTICYAFMQAAGMVNDHLTCCFRNSELGILLHEGAKDSI
jgi:DNA-3-methyladenine glycosylase I